MQERSQSPNRSKFQSAFCLVAISLFPVRPGDLQPSDTKWLDPDITSMVRIVKRPLTSDKRTFVERIEYLTQIPSVWPVPRIPIAYVVELSNPDFNICDDHRNLISVDGLIKRAVSDGSVHPYNSQF